MTLAVVLLMTVTPHLSAAQIQHGGTPYSFGHTVQGNVPTETMRPVDVQALKQEDRANRQSDNPAPPRFGAALDVSLGLQNAGQWTDLSDGGRLWRLRIASQAAHSLNFIFDRFRLPEGGKLFLYNQDHPNPVAHQTSIRFALPEKQHVRLVIYDLMGRTVAKLVNQTKLAGYHRVSFTPDGLGSGVYVYRITAGPYRVTRRMTVLR